MVRTEEQKMKHREKMRKWRLDNPEKAREIVRRSTKRHKLKYNAKRREKYIADPDYKKKRQQYDQNYRKSGRRSIAMAKSPETHRIKSKEWKLKNSTRAKQYARKYRETVQLGKEQTQRKNLDRRYVIGVIKKQTNYTLKSCDIPEELIETKTHILKLKRQLQNEESNI